MVSLVPGITKHQGQDGREEGRMPDTKTKKDSKARGPRCSWARGRALGKAGRSLGAQWTRRGCRAPERSDGGARAKAYGARRAEAPAAAAGKPTPSRARPAAGGGGGAGGGAGGAGEAGAEALPPGAAQALLAPC